ncbi:MAG TPA: HEAT repeat domain-containing protein, partial [Gemmatimonadaceae bacterium]|nr:HEAT repeat domain-containing protein [Gemmatimonadaceae bacterium]
MRQTTTFVVLALAAGIARPALTQSLADRVASASTPRVQFSFAARANVCGNGRSFIQVSGGEWYGSWNDGDRREPCVAGPVRVVLDRAGREIVSIATFVGPAPEPSQGVTNLGTVRAQDAANYLLGFAERADGRVSRDAILPAVLADSADLTPRLVAIARNQNAARETRRSAISWLGRPLDARERPVQEVAAVLVQIGKDEDENQSVRQQGMRTLARLEHGAGTAALMELARDAQRSWMAREALSALNASGDPRARQYLRDAVRRADMPDDVLAAAIRGVGGDYATGEDVKLLREVYPKLPGERSREAALQAVANFGGSDNVQWLVAMAKNPDQPTQVRRRAIQHAYRGGASVGEIIKTYDETTDTQLKESIMNVLVESGDRQATDKLMLIAQKDESSQMRRKALNALSRSSDERVKKFLSGIV